MPVEWHGDQVIDKLYKEIGQRLDRAGSEWVRHAVRKLNAKDRQRSSPGGYPSKQDGHLSRNVAYETDLDKLVTRVGTNVEYARYLEMGTRASMGRYVPKLGKRIKKGMHPGVKKRPWMALTNKAMKKRIAEILGKPL